MKFRNIWEIKKAYTEGIYADTPQNRKLGRVGMSYTDYNSITENEDNKAYYSYSKDTFNDKEEVLNWIYKYIQKFGGSLNTEETKNFVRLFEKRYEIDGGKGERLLKGLINHDAFKYGYDGGFDTNFGLYNINLNKKKEINNDTNNEKPKKEKFLSKYDMAYEMEKLNPSMPYTKMYDAYTREEWKEMYESLKAKNKEKD